MTEKDTRSTLLTSFLNTPHREIETLQPLHEELVTGDPLFYQHLAAWYFDHGVVRDHRLLLVANLCLSTFPNHREVGLALLHKLAPYEVQRVIKYIKGDDIERSVPTGERDAKKHRVMRQEKVHYGLFKNVPRSLRTEVGRYLAQREANETGFCQLAVGSRQALLDLYAGLHLQPGILAQQVLFAKQPPAGSLPDIVKQLAKISDPAQQAELLVQHKVPFRIAVSVIKLAPATLVALIATMTPQEVINNLSFIKEKGAFEHPEIKALVEEKLKAGKTDKRVQALKTQVAAQSVTDSKIADLLDEVADARLQANDKITRSTAILIDKSSSMDDAIEVGKTLLAMIGGICTGKLAAWAFDTVAYPIALPDKITPSSLEKAMLGILPRGATSCGVSIDALLKSGQDFEQVVMITDEQENNTPFFSNSITKYAKEKGGLPDFIFLKVGDASSKLEDVCRQQEVSYQVLNPGKDYYALPNILPLLSQPTMAELVGVILAYPLPARPESVTAGKGNK